jgi:hypothetical protein
MSLTISIKRVLSEITTQGARFSLGYRKTDGTWGEKKNVGLRRNSNALNVRKKMSRSGRLPLLNLNTGKDFEIYIDLLVEFNGCGVDFLI